MILARLFRVAFALAIAAVVLVLFAYAFLAALIVVPVLALLFFLPALGVTQGWTAGGTTGITATEPACGTQYGQRGVSADLAGPDCLPASSEATASSTT